ncbi:MAG: hypothetical protein AB8H47_23870 [Bacteroidia bacterium]
MDHAIRRKLVDLARIRGAKISYQALSDEFQLNLDMKKKKDRSFMAKVLSDISEYEFKNSRPLLSSLVLLKGRTGKQMDDFYKFCEELGMGGWEDLKANPEFEAGQRITCHQFWKETQNYKNYRFVYDEVV